MFIFDLQLFGGGKGGSTTVQSYQPTEQEQRLQKQAADYSEAVAPNALWLNDQAKSLLANSIGSTQVDFNKLNNTAQGLITNSQSGVSSLLNGELPSAYQQNMEDSIKKGVQNSMGTMLTDLGNRGVLNSSVTNAGISGINDSAANAMTNAYQQNIGLLSQLYGQQNDTATKGITAGAAAQEAAQQPALNLWNASLGLNGATTGVLGSIAGQGTKTASSDTSGNGLFGQVLGGLATGAGSAWCFTADTKVRTPVGDIPIKNLRVGDTVICPKDGTAENDAEGTVLETMQPHYSDVYALVCTDASNHKHCVSTTLTQPFMGADGTFITLDKLDAGHTKLIYGGQPVTVLSIIYSGERKVYDLKVSGPNAYYANGFIARGGTTEW